MDSLEFGCLPYPWPLFSLISVFENFSAAAAFPPLEEGRDRTGHCYKEVEIKELFKRGGGVGGWAECCQRSTTALCLDIFGDLRHGNTAERASKTLIGWPIHRIMWWIGKRQPKTENRSEIIILIDSTCVQSGSIVVVHFDFCVTLKRGKHIFDTTRN